jgi:hypothetical protein
MNDPTITCPNCKSSIRLTESLAAPLIEATRQKLQSEFARRNDDIEKRETELLEKQKTLAKERQSIDGTVTEMLLVAREELVIEEANKARLAISNELAKKDDEVTFLRDVVRQRDDKLAEIRKSEVALMRKQLELDNAITDQQVTIEKRVQ